MCEYIGIKRHNRLVYTYMCMCVGYLCILQCINLSVYFPNRCVYKQVLWHHSTLLYCAGPMMSSALSVSNFELKTSVLIDFGKIKVNQSRIFRLKVNKCCDLPTNINRSDYSFALEKLHPGMAGKDEALFDPNLPLQLKKG